MLPEIHFLSLHRRNQSILPRFHRRENIASGSRARTYNLGVVEVTGGSEDPPYPLLSGSGTMISIERLIASRLKSTSMIDFQIFCLQGKKI